MQKNIKSPFDPVEIIKKFYDPDSKAYPILLAHGKAVARKALQTASGVMHLNPDLDFINEAAMLHDIGICKTNAPGLGCSGKYHYLCHGYLGRKMLTEIGLPEHGLVCERHIGVGITAREIRLNRLPLPERDMLPISLEERIIAFADKFFSKKNRQPVEETPVEEIKNNLRKFDKEKATIFQAWVDFFG